MLTSLRYFHTARAKPSAVLGRTEQQLGHVWPVSALTDPKKETVSPNAAAWPWRSAAFARSGVPQPHIVSYANRSRKEPNRSRSSSPVYSGDLKSALETGRTNRRDRPGSWTVSNLRARRGPRNTGLWTGSGEVSAFGNAWLGREDSNLRMAESKSAALPLGYAPTRREAISGLGGKRADNSSGFSAPQWLSARFCAQDTAPRPSSRGKNVLRSALEPQTRTPTRSLGPGW